MVTNCRGGEENRMFSFNFIQHICEYDEVLNPSFLSFFIFQFFFSILSFFFFTTIFSAKLLFYLHVEQTEKESFSSIFIMEQTEKEIVYFQFYVCFCLKHNPRSRCIHHLSYYRSVLLYYSFIYLHYAIYTHLFTLT